MWLNPPCSLDLVLVLPQDLVADTVAGQLASGRARFSVPVRVFIPVITSHSPHNWKSYLHSPAQEKWTHRGMHSDIGKIGKDGWKGYEQTSSWLSIKTQCCYVVKGMFLSRKFNILVVTKQLYIMQICRFPDSTWRRNLKRNLKNSQSL